MPGLEEMGVETRWDGSGFFPVFTDFSILFTWLQLKT